MENEPSDVPFRSVNLAGIRQRVNTIMNHDVVLALLDAKPDAEEFLRLAQALQQCLGFDISLTTIQDSLTHLGGRQLTESVLLQEAHRLSANRHRLRQGRTIGPWRGQNVDEWVALEVLEQQPRRTWRNDLGADVSLAVLSGRAAGETTTLCWSYKFISNLSRHLGFSGRSREERQLQDPLELVSLCLYGLLRARQSLGRIYCNKFRCTASQLKRNRQIISDRKRITFACPLKYTHPCWTCPIGYDLCQVGVHPRSYVKQRCDKCGQVRWFDPVQLQAGACVRCLIAQRIERRK